MKNDESITWEQAVEWLRKQPDQLDLVRACFYDDPLLDAAKRFSASSEWAATLELIPAAVGKALDFGAGRGISSYALAAAGWQVTALEPDPSMLVGTGAIRGLAAETSLPITVAQGFAEEMDFAEGTFDLIYTREVLHHARELNGMLREAARVLKPGGMFIACREHVINSQKDLQTFQASHALHRLYGGENAYTLNEYQEAIRGSGLKIKRIYGNYESAINYFPLSESQWRELITAPLRKRLGSKFAQFLGSSRSPFARRILNMLATIISRLDKTPGRLFTFVAIKPG